MWHKWDKGFNICNTFYAGFNPVILTHHFLSNFVLRGSVAKAAFATEKGTFNCESFIFTDTQNKDMGVNYFLS